MVAGRFQCALHNFSDDTDGSEISGAKDGTTSATPDRNILSEHHSEKVKLTMYPLKRPGKYAYLPLF